MTFSPLIKGTVPHHNKFSSRQGQPIVRVIPHHWAGTAGGDTRLMDPDVKASANYLVYNDGTIKGQVPEEYRAWTSGSFAADAPSITIETQNSERGGDWPVSDAALLSIIMLTADIAERHGWKAVAKSNVRGHREFASTACPGPYLWSQFGHIVAASNEALTGELFAPDTPPAKNKTTWQLSDEVLAGLHGSGDARRRSLGSRYSEVQALVNRRLGAKPQPAPKSISQLADEVLAGRHGNGDARKRALGSQYAAVQREINRRLGANRSQGPNISQLADAVLRGQYGNGPERRRRLGVNYAAVQAEVNRRLR